MFSTYLRAGRGEQQLRVSLLLLQWQIAFIIIIFILIKSRLQQQHSSQILQTPFTIICCETGNLNYYLYYIVSIKQNKTSINPFVCFVLLECLGTTRRWQQIHIIWKLLQNQRFRNQRWSLCGSVSCVLNNINVFFLLQFCFKVWSSASERCHMHQDFGSSLQGVILSSMKAALTPSIYYCSSLAASGVCCRVEADFPGSEPVQLVSVNQFLFQCSRTASSSHLRQQWWTSCLWRDCKIIQKWTCLFEPYIFNIKT